MIVIITTPFIDEKQSTNFKELSPLQGEEDIDTVARVSAIPGPAETVWKQKLLGGFPC